LFPVATSRCRPEKSEEHSLDGPDLEERSDDDAHSGDDESFSANTEELDEVEGFSFCLRLVGLLEDPIFVSCSDQSLSLSEFSVPHQA
jgi:hypothetical protein